MARIEFGAAGPARHLDPAQRALSIDPLTLLREEWPFLNAEAGRPRTVARVVNSDIIPMSGAANSRTSRLGHA